MKKIPFILLVCLFLSSCAPVQTPVAVTSTPAPASPIDGQWQGTGSTADGRPFKIYLTIQNSNLAGLIYNFTGSDGISCTAIEYGQIPPAKQPKVLNNELDASLGTDFVITALFESDSTVSGHLTVRWHERQPRCNGDYEVTWSAAKQIPQSVSINKSAKPQRAKST